MHLLVDTSRSMDYGSTLDEPRASAPGVELNKFTYAQRLTAALAFVALAAGDRLTVCALRAEAPADQFGPARGRAHTLRLLPNLVDRIMASP